MLIYGKLAWLYFHCCCHFFIYLFPEWKLWYFHQSTIVRPHLMLWASQRSVQFSHSVMSESLQPHGLLHASPSPTPGVTKTHVLWVSVAIQPSHPLKDQAWINPGKKILLLSIMKRKIKDSLLPSVERLRLTSLWLGFNLFSMECLDVIAILHFN